jgi:S1-C subfamily serine protease
MSVDYASTVTGIAAGTSHSTINDCVHYASVVKIFCVIMAPDHTMPWRMDRQSTTTASGFVIPHHRILTNAHAVTYASSVRVRKHGETVKYAARVVLMAHDCDLAILTVEEESFWKDLEPLHFGTIPHLQENVTVIGYPTGGDTLSITKGVVSRVLMHPYSHSGRHMLAIQIDAAINSGNSGGPVLQNSKVVGVAFECLTRTQNIGYIIPVPVIEHVLHEFEKHGTYNGFPSLGMTIQTLENDSLRAFHNIPRDVHGVLIVRTEPLNPCTAVLRSGDVVTAIDDIKIADDGSVEFRNGERLTMWYIQQRKHIGESTNISLVREGKHIHVSSILGAPQRLVPVHLYDQPTQYLIYGGCVFTILSLPYIANAWGEEWHHHTPLQLQHRLRLGMRRKEEEQVVILSQILVDSINHGYDTSFHNLILMTLNGIEIENLSHLAETLDAETAKKTPFMQFGLDENKFLVLNSAEAIAVEERILRENNIPAPRSKCIAQDGYASDHAQEERKRPRTE